MKPQDWGAITEKGNLVYIHLFKTDGEEFFIKMPYKVKSAKMEGRLLPVKQLDDQYIGIDLRNVPIDPVDAIIQLEVVK
jgi:alpha-L-fucosidase